MRGRRRVRFVTGGEDRCFTTSRRRGSLPSRDDWAPVMTRRGGHPGFCCRLATSAERRQWPVLKQEQSFWLVECDACAAWAYGRKKRDVRAWGEEHAVRAHRSRWRWDNNHLRRK